MDEDEESMILWELCPEPAFLIFPYIFFNAFSDFSLEKDTRKRYLRKM
jgi:hypothetical protein